TLFRSRRWRSSVNLPRPPIELLLRDIHCSEISIRSHWQFLHPTLHHPAAWRTGVRHGAAGPHQACSGPSTLPPAASIAARAPAVASRPLSTSFFETSPFLTILACLAVAGTSLAARRAAKSMSPSSLSSWYSITCAVSPLIPERKPTFGRRVCIGIWPPSKPALILPLPERANEPLWPRPAVLPRPEPMPRPTRLRSVRAPSAGESVFMRMSYSSTR